MFWYYWHLSVKDWHDYFGVIFYQTHLREHTVQMCKAVDVAAFDSNSKDYKYVLANNPAYLEYLCELQYHPKRFAQYKIN